MSFLGGVARRASSSSIGQNRISLFSFRRSLNSIRFYPTPTTKVSICLKLAQTNPFQSNIHTKPALLSHNGDEQQFASIESLAIGIAVTGDDDTRKTLDNFDTLKLRL